ncbi:MAG TPA: hypothetical protein VKG38_06735 [Solirubrobacteraceae bacterium]|nr:hypothetical protein [Solirubrobacteraceae bacterium]
MSTGGSANAGLVSQDGQRPVTLIVLGYLAAVLMPLVGLLVGLIAVSRPGSWTRKQGALIIALSTVLITLGIGLAPMLADSYFAGKAQRELNAVSQETRRADQESDRKLQAEDAKLHEEERATEVRIAQLRSRRRTSPDGS